jgi:diguanylate cyclase (GGDEF)-like protein/PAS domain S-box-containing protein
MRRFVLLRSLKSRIVAMVLATALLVAFGTAALMLSATERDLRRMLEAGERANRERTAALLSSKAQTLVDALQRVARQASTVAWEPSALEPLLTEPALYSLYGGVGAAGPDGRSLLIVDQGKPIAARPHLGDRDYFRQAMAGDQPVISRALRTRVSDEPLVAVAVPVFAPDGGRKGVLVGAIRLQSTSLFSSLRHKEAEDGAVDLVIDRDGAILSHPNPDRVLGRAADEPGLRDFVLRWQADGSPIDLDGRAEMSGEYFVSSAGIALTDWLHVSVMPAAVAMEPISQARAAAAWSGGTMALLAALLATGLAWRLVRPLGALRRRVEQLQAGGDRAEWPSGDDEIGAVSRSFRALLAQRHDQQAALRDLFQQLEAVLDNAEVGIALSRDGRFVMVSSRFCRLMRGGRERLIGQSTRVIHASDAAYEAFSDRAYPAFMAQGLFEGEVPLVRLDGESFWAHMRGRAVVPGDRSQGTIWVVDDVTETRRQRESLSWAASHDALTGLANRAAFEGLLEELNAQAAARPFCALFIDLDRFKPVNDTGGHAAGDALLKGIAQTLQACLRQSDTVARLGGDEFAVLLPGCPIERARELAEELRAAIEHYRLDWDGRTFGVGASVGLVVATGTHASAADLLREADAACYAAKRGGRNRVVMA